MVLGKGPRSADEMGFVRVGLDDSFFSLSVGGLQGGPTVKGCIAAQYPRGRGYSAKVLFLSSSGN